MSNSNIIPRVVVYNLAGEIVLNKYFSLQKFDDGGKLYYEIRDVTKVPLGDFVLTSLKTGARVPCTDYNLRHSKEYREMLQNNVFEIQFTELPRKKKRQEQ